jgi:hypothetical protein
MKVKEIKKDVPIEVKKEMEKTRGFDNVVKCSKFWIVRFCKNFFVEVIFGSNSKQLKNTKKLV